MDPRNPPALLRMTVGAVIAAGGAFAFLMAQREVTRTGEHSLLGGFGGPALTVLGLGVFLFKGYRQERLDRGEDISQLTPLGLITPRWRAVLAVALLAGFVGYSWLSGWL